jgi:hypothetical protein
LALPPSMIFARAGTSVLTQNIIPSVQTGIKSTQTVLQRIEDYGIDPAVNAILSAPEVVDDWLPHGYIPDLAPGELEGYLEHAMGLDRREREVTINRGAGIANQVTIFTEGDPVMGKRNMFDMLATDDGLTHSGTTELQGDETRIFAPFSIYFPTAMWPYSSETGNRYTVHDLAEESIESDWLGTKPLIEVAMGRKLNKVGALPAYAYWGDIALGTPPTILWGGLAVITALTSGVWAPPLGMRIGALGTAIATGFAGFGEAFTRKIGESIE